MLFDGFRSPVIMASHMKLGWRPSLEGAEVRKKFFTHLLVVLMHAPILQSIESSTLIWGCGVEDGDSLVRQQNFTRTGTPSSLAQDRTGA